ncbi:MAG: site-2 protease family protein [Patescibacteria group bacterium]
MIDQLFSDPALFLVRLLALIYAITVHEFGHALGAYLQGDETAKRMGRLTLNPLAHLDFLGTVVIIFTGIFGWGKPTPYNPFNLRNKKYGSVIVGLAGPLMNLISVVVFGLILTVIGDSIAYDNLLIQFLFTLFLINIVLLVFNLIPLLPLDGSKIVTTLIPVNSGFRQTYERMGAYPLLFLLLIDFGLGVGLLSGLFQWVFRIAFRLFGWI